MAIRSSFLLFFLLFVCSELHAQEARPGTTIQSQSSMEPFKFQRYSSPERERRISEFRKRMSTQQDTLIINSDGAGNRVVLDSTWYTDTGVTRVILGPAGGEISQTGQNNEVTVKSSGQKQKVVVSQSGDNNRVKINSGN